MNEQEEWRTGQLQGFLWTDVLGNDGNAVARVLTHKMVRPYASEPDPEGVANLALIKAAPRLLRICQALLPLAEAEAIYLEATADTPSAKETALRAWAAIDAADQLIEEAQP